MSRFDDVIHKFKAGWRPGTIHEARILRRAVLTLSTEQAGLSKQMADVALECIIKNCSGSIEGKLDLAEGYSTAGTAHLPEEIGVRYLNIAFVMLRGLVDEIPFTVGMEYDGQKIEEQVPWSLRIESRAVAEPRNLETNVLMQYVRTSERLGHYYSKTDQQRALRLLLGAAEVLEWLGETNPVKHDARFAGTVCTLSFRTYENLGYVLAEHFGDADLAREYYMAARRCGDELKRSGHMLPSCEPVYGMLVAATGGSHSKA